MITIYPNHIRRTIKSTKRPILISITQPHIKGHSHPHTNPNKSNQTNYN